MEPTLEEGGEGDEKGPHGFEVIQVSPPPVNPKGFINSFQQFKKSMALESQIFKAMKHNLKMNVQI